jgi:hypothetical protein
MGPGVTDVSSVDVAGRTVAGAATAELSASAAAASASEGIWIVVPATTCAVSGSPLAAASERVVKLLAAAIDQSVSPG